MGLLRNCHGIRLCILAFHAYNVKHNENLCGMNLCGMNLCGMNLCYWCLTCIICINKTQTDIRMLFYRVCQMNFLIPQDDLACVHNLYYINRAAIGSAYTVFYQRIIIQPWTLFNNGLIYSLLCVCYHSSCFYCFHSTWRHLPSLQLSIQQCPNPLTVDQSRDYKW